MHPRCLPKAVAAAYCSLTSQGFDTWVRRGLVPGALPGTQRWDRKALDRLSGLAEAEPHPEGAAPESLEALRGRCQAPR
jgi:hypothetical protein